MRAAVIGAGVAGLCCALELARRGVEIEIFERAERLGASACSWYAGGMLAPWCEGESAEPLVTALGEEAIGWWRAHFPGTAQRGSLVVAHGRDMGALETFARRTERHEWLDRARIGELEPHLAGRFGNALYFPTEAHLDPREALAFLAAQLDALGAVFRFGHSASSLEHASDRRVVDCRGLAARSALPDLRGVKGEMVLLRTHDVAVHRPIRVLHPRIPLYVVPRGDGLFMVGATSIESDQPTRVSARSALELLGAAYALHPAFGEAEIVEIGTGVRPAFPDNLPRIRRCADGLRVNGLYRHGFLLAPALARRAAGALLEDRFYPEVMDEAHRERPLA